MHLDGELKKINVEDWHSYIKGVCIIDERNQSVTVCSGYYIWYYSHITYYHSRKDFALALYSNMYSC